MYLTEEDVRAYLQDVSFEDNDVLGDLRFTSEQIDAAMRGAAREWNSLPPLICPITNGAQLPGDTNIFLDAIAAQLYRGLAAKLSAEDIPLNAGNMTGDITARQLQHCRKLAQEYQQRFVAAAVQYKRTINIQRAFGQIG